jgi:hypothetical protein
MIEILLLGYLLRELGKLTSSFGTALGSATKYLWKREAARLEKE